MKLFVKIFNKLLIYLLPLHAYSFFLMFSFLFVRGTRNYYDLFYKSVMETGYLAATNIDDDSLTPTERNCTRSISSFFHQWLVVFTTWTRMNCCPAVLTVVLYTIVRKWCEVNFSLSTSKHFGKAII